MLKIKGIIFKLIHCLQSLSNPVTLSASDTNAEHSFCLCNPILSCRPSEEHYFFCKIHEHRSVSTLRADLNEAVWRGIDWCLVCWSMTVHIKVNTPLEHVSTSVHHVSAQESRHLEQCFLPPARYCCVLITHHFNILGFIFM